MTDPTQPPLILISNDDGIEAQGLAALEAAMSTLGEVWVVAPATEQSGVSNALSLHDPLRVREHAPRRLSITGTPTDCVYMAMHLLLPRRPALCVSGVNHGANLADDVLYSGTVAAAIEATLCGIPSLAVSLAGWGKGLDYAPAARLALRVASQMLHRPMPRGVLLSLNVPAGASDDVAITTTRMGRRNYSREVTSLRDPRGKPYFWIGGSELAADDLPGSDCNAVAAGHAALTPLQLDMTHYHFMRELRDWPL